jgi:hypothetical protein
MATPTRRSLLIALAVAPLAALTSCSESEVVIGKGASNGRRKGREESEIKRKRTTRRGGAS